MDNWVEFRFWYSVKPLPSQLFNYKRSTLLPALRARLIEHFLILDEPEFMLVRTPLNVGFKEEFPAVLQPSLAPLFSKITVESWSAIDDARIRILSAKEKLPGQPLPDDGDGWDVQGKNPQGQWLISAVDLDSEAEAFAKFMTRVAGSSQRRLSVRCHRGLRTDG